MVSLMLKVIYLLPIVLKNWWKPLTANTFALQYIEGKIGKDKFIEQIAIIADAKNMFQP